MKIGDVVYTKTKQPRATGLIPADGKGFRVNLFPELAELYEFENKLPDGLKQMWVPALEARRGRRPHIVGKLPLQGVAKPRR